MRYKKNCIGSFSDNFYKMYNSVPNSIKTRLLEGWLPFVLLEMIYKKVAFVKKGLSGRALWENFVNSTQLFFSQKKSSFNGIKVIIIK